LKVVIDTNVIISALFFSGVPYLILEAWRDGRIDIVTSPEILDEYRRVGEMLQKGHPGIDIEPLLSLVAIQSEVIIPMELQDQVCMDKDDDKFLACALAGGCAMIISGDKLLRKISRYKGVRIVTPREFLEEVLQN
jgi:putative PIN family toxin of toxin-antitoxin system